MPKIFSRHKTFSPRLPPAPIDHRTLRAHLPYTEVHGVKVLLRFFLTPRHSVTSRRFPTPIQFRLAREHSTFSVPGYKIPTQPEPGPSLTSAHHQNALCSQQNPSRSQMTRDKGLITICLDASRCAQFFQSQIANQKSQITKARNKNPEQPHLTHPLKPPQKPPSAPPPTSSRTPCPRKISPPPPATRLPPPSPSRPYSARAADHSAGSRSHPP